MTPSLPRGMRDIEARDYALIEQVRSSFLETSRLFDFPTMEPSPLELMSTLEAKAGSSIKDEIFYFTDKGGREVGLRFDLTVGITRYVCARKELQPPVKMGCFSSMWRYDEPQHGRYRWFHQWDAEIFGVADCSAEGEVIEFTSSVFNKLGLGIRIEIGNRTIVQDYINKKLRITSQKDVFELLRAIDKVGKKTNEELIKEYSPLGFKREDLIELFEFAAIKGTWDKVSPLLNDYDIDGTSLEELFHNIIDRKIKSVEINLGIVRGLDYYTGTVFEVFSSKDETIGALAGGGRYDSLPTAFGRADLTAVGVAGGVDRMISLLNVRMNNKSKVVLVAYTSDEMKGMATTITSTLRSAGIACIHDIMGRSLRKQLELASSRAVGKVVIVGPKELASGEVTLRNMKEGSEERVLIVDLPVILR
ncbi:MAG: histidine--tRNA ligase [Thaumarchaeota archaeon]|nr:histidine--tRNA ligase [Nitrososphaerota archaeon]